MREEEDRGGCRAPCWPRGAQEADAVPTSVMTKASRSPLGGNSMLTWKWFVLRGFGEKAPTVPGRLGTNAAICQAAGGLGARPGARSFL